MIGRLLHWARRAPTPAADRAAGQPAAAPPSLPAVAAYQPISIAVADAPPWRLVARCPLINRTGRIAGWNLQLTTAAAERSDRHDAPKVLRQAYWYALAQAADAVLQTQRLALLAPPGLALADAQFLRQLPAGCVLRLADPVTAALSADSVAALQVLQARGVKVAAAGGYAPLDYLLLDRGNMAAATNHPHQRIALGLSSFEEVTAAVRSGVDLCGGSFLRAGLARRRSSLPTHTARAAQLLSAVAARESPRDIAELFKGDVALSFRLLRLVNSAAFRRGESVSSLLDAVMRIGARELHRWLCVLLLTADSEATLAPALHETALARGRLMELLAQASTRAAPPDALFVTGTFSLLDLLLDVPLEVALALAALPEPAQDALIAERGPWRPYLDIALAIEEGDADRLERACLSLGVATDQAAALAHQAGQWAAGVAADLGGAHEKAAT